MEEAKKRFASANRQTLAQWAEQKAKEEAGHDQLALLDIKSMGYQSEAVVEVLVPPAAKSLLDYFTRSVEESDPIECVGYSYTAERLGICIGEGYIQSVEALLPPGIRATRCLRAHSAMSTEVEHVKETVEMIAELTYQERDRVAKACYQTALLRFSPPEEAYISDEEIESILKPLQMTNNHD
jgi:pyrroloquinoline quinone (PQQ) biosynthesis protein C